MNGKFSPKLLAAGVLVLVALVAVGGWFGVVAPQRSKATTLEQQIVEEREKLSVAKVLSRSQKASKNGLTSGLSLLNIAMPSSVQMPSVLRQVQRLAALSDVRLESFTPTVGTTLSGYDAVPIDVNVLGRYGDVQSFLRRLRLHANSGGGRIQAAGRLFDVQNVGLAPSGTEAPQLSATIRLAVFVYTGKPVLTAEEAAAAGEAEPTTAPAAEGEGMTS